MLPPFAVFPPGPAAAAAAAVRNGTLSVDRRRRHRHRRHDLTTRARNNHGKVVNIRAPSALAVEKKLPFFGPKYLSACQAVTRYKIESEPLGPCCCESQYTIQCWRLQHC